MAVIVYHFIRQMSDFDTVSSVVRSCCVDGDCRGLNVKQAKAAKTFQKKGAQRTDCRRTSSSTCSGPAIITRRLLCRCTRGIYSRPIYHKHMLLYVTFLRQPRLFACLLTVNPLPSQLMIHLLSVNQFVKLGNYPTPQGVPGNL